ncbi:MAG: hypothetical protein EKK37_17415 [Sphingobacteriales bacterium]|nr:MAG: hypothetical protein EKK37_17415 [Sphingobacteriales bacterium]
MFFQIKLTDKAFKTSPDAGHPDCLCSRCGNNINSEELPYRCFTINNDGHVDEQTTEYRYCEACQKAAGFIFNGLPMPDSFEGEEIELSECLNCGSIWSPGTEEHDFQRCSACGWQPGMPVDDFEEDD